MGRFDKRRRIVNVIFLPMEKWFRPNRWDRLARMTDCDDVPAPALGAAAGIKHDQARRHFGQEPRQPVARQFIAENWLVFGGCPLNLQSPLRYVDADEVYVFRKRLRR